MSDCDKIIPAIKDITLQSKPEAAAPLVELLKELDKSHIIGTDLFKKAPDQAHQMKAKGVYTADMPGTAPGGHAVLQEGDGRALMFYLMSYT